MSDIGIRDFCSQGGWNSPVSWHVECAALAKSNFISNLSSLEATEIEVRDSASGDNPELIELLIDHETNSSHQEIYRENQSTLLYSCMAIEGFLNLYGTVRLGEKKYKKLLERQGIVEKFCLLCMLCVGEELNPTDEICRSVRYLFDKRNALVHPKTKEITSDNMHQHAYIHPRNLEAPLYFSTLVSFFKYFIAIDPSVKDRSPVEMRVLGLTEERDEN